METSLAEFEQAEKGRTHKAVQRKKKQHRKKKFKQQKRG